MKVNLPIIGQIILMIALAVVTAMNQKTAKGYQNTIANYKAAIVRKDSLYDAATTIYKGHIALRDSTIARQNLIIQRYAKMADNQIKYLKKANQDAQDRINAYHVR